MNYETRTTTHAKKRTKERIGISKKLADKNAKKAMQYGVPRKKTNGKLRRYLDKFEADNVKVYNRYVYLFSWDKALITVIPLPSGLCVRADALQRRMTETTTTTSN